MVRPNQFPPALKYRRTTLVRTRRLQSSTNSRAQPEAENTGKRIAIAKDAPTNSKRPIPATTSFHHMVALPAAYVLYMFSKEQSRTKGDHVATNLP
jgi:hypothetical protein